MYAYAVSLGGIAAAHYLINDDANHNFSGVAIYGCMFNPVQTMPHFKSTMWGLYDIGLGYFLNMKFRD